MRGEENIRHDEHVKMLEALASNLKSEVARGLRLLDTCVTNIAQAKWILTNVDDSLSGFSKGCPVCGTLPDRDSKLPVKSTGKEIKSKPVPTTNDSPSPKRQVEPDRVVPIKPIVTKPLRKQSPSPSPPPRSKPPPPVSAPPVSVHRVGPRSKTQPIPNDTQPSTSAVTTTDPKPKHSVGPRSKTQLIPNVTPPATSTISTTDPKPTQSEKVPDKSVLPKACSIVIDQTVVKIKLTDIKPYLHGQHTKVDLTKLTGFVSPIQVIPSNLKFTPKQIRVKADPPVRKSLPGPASRKFMESFKSSTAPAKVQNVTLDSDSSSDDKQKRSKAPPPPAPPKPPPPKKPSSNSGSDYDYNFAKTPPSSNNKKNKSKIGSPVTLTKRPRPLSTDSDEDYDYKKEKRPKSSIFKKKGLAISDSIDSEDSDRIRERKKKKKLKRKESTEKEKDRTVSSKNALGSKTSSVVSSTRMTITLNSSKSGTIKDKSVSTSKSGSKSRQYSGSTTSSVAKSDTGLTKSDTGATGPKSDSGKTSISESKVVEGIAPAGYVKKPGYRPGPASRKPKPVQSSAPPVTETPKPVQPVGGSNESASFQKNGESAQKDKPIPGSASSEVNGVPLPTPKTPTPPASKVDPFTLLKQQIKAQEQSVPVPAPVPKVKPATGSGIAGGGISTLVSNLDNAAKAKLLAKLTRMSSQNNKPIAKSATPTPVQASLQALSSLVKSAQKPKPQLPPVAPPLAPPPVEVVEEEKEIELGDDVIGNCIGNLEEIETTEEVTDSLEEPVLVISFQDCLSPEQMDDTEEAPLPEPDSATLTIVEKIQRELIKLAAELYEDAAELMSQDKINELFSTGLHSNSAEMEIRRTDLQEGIWYLVKDKILGRAACSDTLAVYEWEQIPEEKLKVILKALERHTALPF